MNTSAHTGETVNPRKKRKCGMVLAVLGSDGAGKSTLLQNLQPLLAPLFEEIEMLHFRPGIFQKKSTGAVTDPHGRAARAFLPSGLKVIYYFLDHWAGWWFISRKVRRTGRLLIFDRNFDDLLIDERRYRLSGTRTLVKLLRPLIPKADQTFVLSAPAAVLHARKPELDLEELARQQTALERLGDNSENYILVNAALPPGEVAQLVLRGVTLHLAERNKKQLHH